MESLATRELKRNIAVVMKPILKCGLSHSSNLHLTSTFQMAGMNTFSISISVIATPTALMLM